MSPTSAPIPTDHHDSNDYDPEAPSSSRGPYNYNDLELSIICERLSLYDPPDTSNPADSKGNDPENRWCPKCFIGFPSTEALMEHRRISALHITCQHCEIAEDFANLEGLRQHCYDHHFGCPYREGATFCATVCKTAAALERHFWIDHHSCRFCIFVQHFTTLDDLQDHYRASHTTCPHCPETLVLLYEEELREHCLREHFGCPYCNAVTWSGDEESLKTHIRLEHFPCWLCNYQRVFASLGDLVAHRRTAHGFFDCLFCKPQQPQIIWPASCGEHMQQCYNANPCTEDFHQDAVHMIDYCDLCKKPCEPQNRKIHLLFHHFCQECARYGNMFKMHKEEHFRECSRTGTSAGPQWWHPWQKEYDEAHSARADGPFQLRNVWHEKWQEHQQGKAQQNELARESFQRLHEYFKIRANEQRAPPPTQKPQEPAPAPLDIYTILRISPQSSGDDMKRAVRDRRVETHPAKRKRQGLSKEDEEKIEEEARLIGRAADIMLDPEKRRKHDEQVQAWNMMYGL